MSPAAYPSPQRVAQLRENLSAVRARIAAAAHACGRDPGQLTLIVVTKFFPAADVRALADLGELDLGENRDQEASEKFRQVRRDARYAALRLHFIGQVQTNKAASVAAYADAVHSVDRIKLARALNRGAAAAGRVLPVLVQVDLAEPKPSGGPDDHGDGMRGGVRPDQLAGLVEQLRAEPNLTLRGVMAVAPLSADPNAAFARLADLAAQVSAVAPEANWISAGMSSDLEAAVRHGATHLRVGTAILGTRPTLR